MLKSVVRRRGTLSAHRSYLHWGAAQLQNAGNSTDQILFHDVSYEPGWALAPPVFAFKKKGRR